MNARALAIVLFLALAFVMPGCNGNGAGPGQDQKGAGAAPDPSLRGFWTEDCDVTVSPSVAIEDVGQFEVLYDQPLVAASKRKVVVNFDGWVYHGGKKSKMVVKIDTKETGSNPAPQITMTFRNDKGKKNNYRLELQRNGSVYKAWLYENNSLKWDGVTPDQDGRYSRPTSSAPLVRVEPLNASDAYLHVMYDNTKMTFKLSIDRSP